LQIKIFFSLIYDCILEEKMKYFSYLPTHRSNFWVGERETKNILIYALQPTLTPQKKENLHWDFWELGMGGPSDETGKTEATCDVLQQVWHDKDPSML
jgi:hypothetical protein